MRSLGSRFALTKNIRARERERCDTTSWRSARPSLSGRSLALGSPGTGVRVRVSPRSWCLYRRERRGDAPPRGYVEAELEFLDRTRGLILHARSSARCLTVRCRSVPSAETGDEIVFGHCHSFVRRLDSRISLGKEQLVAKQLVDSL